MPIFYFHIRRGDELETDDTGVELPSLEAAKDEARRTAGELLREGNLKPSEVLEVMDEKKEVVLRFRCGHVLPLGGCAAARVSLSLFAP